MNEELVIVLSATRVQARYCQRMLKGAQSKKTVLRCLKVRFMSVRVIPVTAISNTSDVNGFCRYINREYIKRLFINRVFCSG